MTPSKKRIIWKQDRVFSIRLRNGHYALLQMLASKGQVAVFNRFQDVDEWSTVRLTKKNVLFMGYVLRAVTSRSVITVHKNAAAVAGLKYSNTSIDIGSDFWTMKVWKGTKHEREFLMMGGNGEFSLCRYYQKNGVHYEKYSPIAVEDYNKYKDVELTNLNDYPSFNERLYLCESFGRNVDPLKEIAFGRPLPVEYRTYIDIIAGKTRLSELGY